MKRARVLAGVGLGLGLIGLASVAAGTIDIAHVADATGTQLLLMVGALTVLHLATSITLGKRGR